MHTHAHAHVHWTTPIATNENENENRFNIFSLKVKETNADKSKRISSFDITEFMNCFPFSG